MNLQSFKLSLSKNQPPQGLFPALQALWHQGKGDWEAAHTIAQYDKSPMGCLVHAHLHRCEGDKSNAAYWYRLAGKDVCNSRLAEEWKEIVEVLLT